MHTGMTHNIVARQECDISVSHLYKWALRVVGYMELLFRQGRCHITQAAQANEFSYQSARCSLHL